MSSDKIYLESLESEIASIEYIQLELVNKGTFATEEEIRNAIGAVISDCCKDTQNNYTESKSMLITRFGGPSDLTRLNEYISNYQKYNSE